MLVPVKANDGLDATDAEDASRYKEYISFELRGFSTKSKGVQFFWRAQRTGLVHANLVERYPPGQGPTRVADVGSGPGIVTSFFAKQGYHTCAIDKVKTLIDFARKLFHVQGQKGEFVVADVDTDAEFFKEGGFDAIICIDAFEHFSKPSKAVQNFKRLLGPRGGHVFLTTPNFRNPVFAMIETLWDKVGKTPGWRQLHVTRMSLKEIAALFETHGFTIELAGTFLLASPFVAMFSRRLARKLSYVENYLLQRFHVGFMIYLVARTKTTSQETGRQA